MGTVRSKVARVIRRVLHMPTGWPPWRRPRQVFGDQRARAGVTTSARVCRRHGPLTIVSVMVQLVGV